MRLSPLGLAFHEVLIEAGLPTAEVEGRLRQAVAPTIWLRRTCPLTGSVTSRGFRVVKSRAVLWLLQPTVEGRFNGTAASGTTIRCRTVLPYLAILGVLACIVAAVILGIKALLLPAPYPFVAPLPFLALGYVLLPLLWYHSDETWLIEQVRRVVVGPD